ncbi:MAG: type II secretion system protein [Candidatus Paceibacterota bacterium]|jgi:prepilin-type N-terminal cleavage/methylation domain-containing protein
MKLSFKHGFTLVELLVVVAIMSVVSMIIFNTFVTFKTNQALNMDTDTVVEVLRQARNQTLTSKNSSSYGVHFSSTKVTLFVGTSYIAGSPTNQDFILSSTDTILTISLTPSGSDVVFDRLTGETVNYGTVVVSSPGISKSKTVTIYKTGLMEYQ